MNLLRLLRRSGPQRLRWLLLAAAGSALATTVVLAIVNAAAQQIAAEHADFVDLKLGLLFAGATVGFLFSQAWLIRLIATDVERAVDQLRLGLADRVRHADLLKLDAFGQTRLFDSISQSSQAISQSSHYLAQTLQSILLIVAIMAYIAVFNLTAFLVIIGMLTVGTWVYRRLGRALKAQSKQAAAAEAVLFESVSDLFDGFKEQRLNSARSQGLSDAFAQASGHAMTARSLLHVQGWSQFISGEFLSYLTLGLVIFVVPAYITGFSAAMAQLTTAVLFLFVPLVGLMNTLKVVEDAEFEAGRMLDLEPQLTALAEVGSSAPGQPLPEDFLTLAMAGVEFAYPADPGERPFTVGPLDVTLQRGEVVFLTGGNGSGKSTFIKLLTGLYRPTTGQLRLDGRPIGPERLAAWREKMATVFSDFRLFARLYGTATSDEQEALRLMRWLEMETVTELQDGRFTRRDLSGGQRKRLALVAALLEGKPILILDEWAADQDPHFRRTFYREIVPGLKRQGLTVIAVTHDDRYFDVADRRLHMEEGRLFELPVPPAPEGRSA